MKCFGLIVGDEVAPLITLDPIYVINICLVFVNQYIVLNRIAFCLLAELITDTLTGTAYNDCAFDIEK